jgi:peptidoglycan hydrolase CwlO-like protein
MEIGIWVSIGAVVISLIALLLSRKDKSNDDTKEDGYKWGQIEEKLSNIEKALAKIETKLDVYDKEIDERIDKKIHEHVEVYHKEKQ